MNRMDEKGLTPITVEVPAHTINMSIVRTVAAAVAARVDLTVDQIEDVRLAIDESMAHLIKHSSDGAVVRCELSAHDSTFAATLRCPSPSSETPEPEQFSWTVLTALVGPVEVTLADGELQMHWTVVREHSVTA